MSYYSFLLIRAYQAERTRGDSESLLMYDDVHIAHSPDHMLLDFCQSTYDAAANLECQKN